MRESDLWELDDGITDVAHRADYGGYKPPAAGWFGRRQGGIQICESFPSVGEFLWSKSFSLQDKTYAEASLGKLHL